MKYSVVTFGCRVNQADSFDAEAELLALGGECTDPQHADLVLVNTCSVTSAADQGARQIIRKIARDNPSARIVVTGCYATRQPGELADLPGVVGIVPNQQKPVLVREIANMWLTTAERFGDGEGACGASIQPGVAGRTAYTLRVQTGCDQTCSYCIIPSTRGRGRSRPLADIASEIVRVAAAGYREIALTGVHLGSYGRDLNDGSSLVALLRTIDKRAPADLRFRISSLEPMDCSADVVALVSSSTRFAPHFHLPLQHASDRVLERMRRPYTSDYYSRLVDDIRARMPHASIGSDVIAGFPGETDGDFEQLEQYLSLSPLTHVHVFPYSDRPGTDASAMGSKVHGSIVRERAGRLREVARSLTARFHRSQHGAMRPGLTIDDGSMVMTDNYLKVLIGSGHVRNEAVMVRINASEAVLTGEIVG